MSKEKLVSDIEKEFITNNYHVLKLREIQEQLLAITGHKLTLSKICAIAGRLRLGDKRNEYRVVLDIDHPVSPE